MTERRKSRRIMRRFRLNEISTVDRPAQEGALFTLNKNQPSEDAIVNSILKRYIDPMEGAKTFGEVLECYAEDKKYSEVMELAWPKVSALDTSLRSIIADRKLEIADKHTTMRNSVEGFLALIRQDMPEVEEVLDKALNSASTKASSKKELKAMTNLKRKARKQDDEIDDDERDDEDENVDTTKELSKLKKMVETQGKLLKEITDERDDARAELSLQKQLSALDEGTQKYYHSLTDDKAKAEFLDLDRTAQQVMMRKSAEKDETIEVEGHTIRKSAVGAGVFAMFKAQAKKTADLEKQVAEETDKRVEVELTKRAEEELAHLPGKLEDKVKLLKSLAKLPEEEHETMKTMFKAANKTASLAFDRIGTNRGINAQKNAATAGFEKRINEVKTRDKCNRQDAMRKARVEFPDEFEAWQNGDGDGEGAVAH